MEENRESFIFHKDWYNAISQLDKDLRLELYDAIMRKALYNEPPSLSPMGNLAMSFIEPQIERDFNKWLDIREKRSNAGKAHKGNQHTASEQMEQMQTKGTNVPSVSTLEQNGTNGTVSVSVSDNVSVDNNSVILKEKEDTKVSPKKKSARFIKPNVEEVDSLFEKCWIAYRRKGSKKKSLEYWNKLSQQEQQSVMPHVKAYVESRDMQYQKDFERYLRDKIFLSVVFKNNNVIYDPVKFESAAYTPQGRTIWYDENTKAYWTDDNFYYGVISDGYTDEDRPDGATLTMNNARGIIRWNSLTKKWEKK